MHVFTTNLDGPGVSDVPLGVPVDMDGVQVWYFPVPAFRRLYWSPGMRAALSKHVKEFDIVHTHSVFLWPTWAAARIAGKCGVPYVLAPRGMLVGELIRRKSAWLKRAWIALFERKNIRDARLIHFTSEVEAKDAEVLGLKFAAACIVPNGIEISAQAAMLPEGVPPADARLPYLLFVGRINWKKGLDRLIGALPHIRGCDLVIAGNDEEGYKPKLERMAEEGGVAERVTFAGPVYGAKKQALMRGACMLVLPSYSENFGNVVLEAMAEACPVAVTPEVGAAGLVRECGGGVVLNGDPGKLGPGINALLSDRDELVRMGMAGQAFVVRRYSWDAVARQMEAAYARAIQGAAADA